MSIFIIAEIGINHNGDIDIAKKLIDVAVLAGADAVKFQKRTVDVVYTKEELDKPREHPFGTTNRELKERLEFGKAQYDEIDRYCKQKGIFWSASAWDLKSQEFLRQYDLKFNKVASAMLTNMPLLNMIAEEGRQTFVSTGMSSLEEIDAAVAVFRKKNCPFELMHAVSTYPCPDEEVNLMMIPKLRERYGVNVGYSGHEGGIAISYAAAALGATSLERHITLNRAMFGSDQAASVEPVGFLQLCGAVRKIQVALGDGVKKLSPAEVAVRKKLRGV
jgi:N-acetylneuraminate synthase